MKIHIPDVVRFCLDRLRECGRQGFLVGGAVRDSLRGIRPVDLDISTDALPERVLEIFSDIPAHPTGLTHGTVTVVPDGIPIEITTFRRDGVYSDGRRPDSVTFCSDIRDDVQRRDFTVNGLAADSAGNVHDYVGGIYDLTQKKVRCIGEPTHRFSEDGLRVLRALRFASVLDFSIDKKTSDAIFVSSGLLSDVAVERIWKEWVLLLCGPGVCAVLRDYAAVFGVIMPELLPMRGFLQKNPCHGFDVFEHTVRVLSHVPAEKKLRLAALFHDIGKPATFCEDEDGVGHFPGHEKVSRDMAGNIMHRFHTDTKTREYVEQRVLYHGLDITSSEKLLRKRLSRFGAELLEDLFAIKRADTLAQSPKAACRTAELERAEALFRKIMEEEGALTRRELAIHGEDVLGVGVSPGKKVGELLSWALEQVLEGTLANERETLLAAVKRKLDDDL